MAAMEDHWTDDSGRVFREFADRILRQPDLRRATIEQLEVTAKGVANKTAEETAKEIAAIDERLAPIADEVRKSVDRRQFDACRLEARDRQRLASERAATTSGYARQFWDVLRRPEVGANALASGLLAAVIGLLFNGVSARLGGEKRP
jgi:hypothetical protein